MSEAGRTLCRLVLRLSICFLNTSLQNSLQMNLITSSESEKRARSAVYLRMRPSPTQIVRPSSPAVCIGLLLAGCCC